MFVGRITKENPDVSRFTVDLTEWLDEGEVATAILMHTITLGTTGWSNTPFPVPGSNPPYDPTPLLYTEAKLVDGGTSVEVYVSFGTPGNVYTCQFEIIGTTLREVTFEVGVQIAGTPPAAPPIVVKPIPPDALSIMGGTMLGPLYLYEDPTYPTEAATKQYVDYANSLTQNTMAGKVNRSGDTMTGFLALYANPVQPLQAATKQYVDQQSGSGLSDAPNDGFYYGRRNFAWGKVTEEAPLNAFGYLRTNGAWAKGIPEAATLDVRATDPTGFGYANISAWQSPPSGNSDLLQLSARRNASGNADDGGVIQLYGPAFPGAGGSVTVVAGNRAAAQVWQFNVNGSLITPGSVLVNGLIRSDIGRVVSRISNVTDLPSVVAWNQPGNAASGFWVGSAGDINFGAADGGGTPLVGWATLTSTGLSVPNISANLIGSNGNIVAAGNLYARGGTVYFGAGDTAHLTSDGTSSIWQFRSDNWNMSWNGINGTLSFNKPGTALFTVDAVGNGGVAGSFQANGGSIAASLDVNAGRNMSATGNIAASGALFAAGSNMVFANGGSGRFMQFSNAWYWDWNSGNGDLMWQTPSGVFLFARQADKVVFDNQGPMGGIGVYQNLSDIRTKRDVRQAPYGLAEVLQLETILFQRIQNPGRDELGFSAQQLREVIPEAVMKMGIPMPDGTGGIDDDEPTLGVGIDGVVVAAINAIKELAARIAALEAR